MLSWHENIMGIDIKKHVNNLLMFLYILLLCLPVKALFTLLAFCYCGKSQNVVYQCAGKTAHLLRKQHVSTYILQTRLLHLE